MKEILILAGPNGAGKTTAARVLLPRKYLPHAFVNADEIARVVSPDDTDAGAIRAGRLMLAKIRTLIEHGTSFAFETTCSGRSYLSILEQCKQAGVFPSCTYGCLHQSIRSHVLRNESVKAVIPFPKM